MLKHQSVLVSISFVVTVPEEEPEVGSPMNPIGEGFLSSVTRRMQPAVDALKSEPWFEQDAGSTYHYLAVDPESPVQDGVEKNVGRCANCGRWTSDYNAPNYLDLLMVGWTIEGKLFCDECYSFGDLDFSPGATVAR